MYKEKIIDVITGEEIFRDYEPDEIAAVENAIVANAEQAAKQAKAQAKRATALAKLEALGLDEADLTALGL